jgi:hypothetical protein
VHNITEKSSNEWMEHLTLQALKTTLRLICLLDMSSEREQYMNFLH